MIQALSAQLSITTSSLVVVERISKGGSKTRPYHLNSKTLRSGWGRRREVLVQPVLPGGFLLFDCLGRSITIQIK